MDQGAETAAAIGEGLDSLAQWLRELWCWLRYGHIWYDVGPVKDQAIMVQCRHCCMTRIINTLTGEVH